MCKQSVNTKNPDSQPAARRRAETTFAGGRAGRIRLSDARGARTRYARDAPIDDRDAQRRNEMIQFDRWWIDDGDGRGRRILLCADS